jgi:uncharacterized membrane protein YpjA
MLDWLLEMIGDIFVEFFLGSIYGFTRYLWQLIRHKRIPRAENALIHT